MMQKYKVRAYLQTSYFMRPVMAESKEAALVCAQKRFDAKYGDGAADDLVLYFNVCSEDEDDGNA